MSASVQYYQGPRISNHTLTTSEWENIIKVLEIVQVSLRTIKEEHAKSQAKNKELEATIKELKDRITELEYQPGGPGYIQTKAEWDAKTKPHGQYLGQPDSDDEDDNWRWQ